LLTLHNLELMAATIYKFQLTMQPTEVERRIIAAMSNEMTHYQDFQVKLYEYGFRPFKLRWIYWLAGFTFGFGSRILGRTMRLKTGVWVEKKAVRHYQTLLDTVPWDDETRKVIEKDQQDEKRHIQQWTMLLESGA
jgi:demethoxyubiquinone hydroxylase (CLK1/Coq7/Cat5 family)